ncbi:DUF6153 family protein [Streptomyces mexicanus]|uniref:DUF6153 family protein n=1 Tax=Streptomyces mexicanus TaxID=178566 RepID=UPI0036A07F9F
MTSGARTRSLASRARWTLLVLAVLAGLLGMHALSPGGMPSVGQHGAMAPMSGHHGAAQPEAARAVHHAAPVHRAGDICRHLSDPDPGGPAMRHAGGTCTAAGTSTGYVPPALLPAPAGPARPAQPARTAPAARAVDGRAPPDLAELQLLRI